MSGASGRRARINAANVLAAAALVALSVFTAVVRAEIVTEGYALARAREECERHERRARAMDVRLLQTFAGLQELDWEGMR